MIKIMNVKYEKFKSGWVGISLALSPDEIDLFIQRLTELKIGRIGHFHVRNEDFSAEEGISDIEITTIGGNESDNMIID